MPLVAAAAGDILAQLGFGEVELAASADAALDLIERFCFQFALLSVAHHSGTAMSEVASRLDQAGVPFVLVSDLADGRDRPPELLESRYVTKPYCLTDIAHALGLTVPARMVR